MRHFSSIAAAFLLVIVLIAVEIVIIKSTSKYEPQLGIVFAKVKIPEKAVITPEMVEVKKVGVSYVHRQSIRSAGAVLTKKAKMDIEAGEMLLSGKLGSDDMEEIAVKDKSKRLFSVEFKGDQANGWWLKVDQNVDIIFISNERSEAHPAPDTADSMKKDTQISAGSTSKDKMQILRNIRIAALIDDKGKLLKNSARDTLPKYISFEVTDGQAGFLAYAKSNGRLEVSVIPGQ